MLGLSLKKHRQSGDTLIEVLFAVSVFSLVAIGGLTLMNQGSNTSQRALEITLVRQEIDAQAESLRFLHNSYIASYQPGVSTYPANPPAEQWVAMVASIKATETTVVSNFGNYTTCPGSSPSGGFVINAKAAKFVAPSEFRAKFKEAEVFSRVKYDDTTILASHGLWIEAIRSADTSSDPDRANVGFIDFHIRACWDSVGLSVPMTIGTIVRLYEPR